MFDRAADRERVFQKAGLENNSTYVVLYIYIYIFVYVHNMCVYVCIYAYMYMCTHGIPPSYPHFLGGFKLCGGRIGSGVKYLLTPCMLTSEARFQASGSSGRCPC